jgi:tRNA (guanine37-N1)-methyltransferase
LEYDQYTQPRVFRDVDTPEVLFSGHHEKIRLWKFENSLRLTAERRPDLFFSFLEKTRTEKGFTKAEKKIIAAVTAEFPEK